MRYLTLADVLSAVGDTVEFSEITFTDIDARGNFGNTPLAVVMSWKSGL
jgi:hypothetical protein